MCNISLEHRSLQVPLVQGGMGIGISLGNLAGHVAKLGGMGVVSGVQIGFQEEDFMQNPDGANRRAIFREIEKAKHIAQGKGIIGVNVMTAMQKSKKIVQDAVDAGADAIICGAGLALGLAEWVPKDTLIAPIVSSRRALEILIKAWGQRAKRLPSFVVVEGPEAGGHLGFKMHELATASLEKIVEDVRLSLEQTTKEITIPVFAAGGIRSIADRKRLQASGATGVQLGTPFIATEECDADRAFKETIVEATDKDLTIIQSPAGFPARAIRNNFLRELKLGEVAPRRCIGCLKTCDPLKSPYCIAKSLVKSAKGQSGLVFSGARINGINKIGRVEDVFQQVVGDLLWV